MFSMPKDWNWFKCKWTMWFSLQVTTGFPSSDFIPPVDINADKLFISHLHFPMSQRDIIPLGTCDLSHIMKRKEYLEHHIMREKVA